MLSGPYLLDWERSASLGSSKAQNSRRCELLTGETQKVLFGKKLKIAIDFAVTKAIAEKMPTRENEVVNRTLEIARTENEIINRTLELARAEYAQAAINVGIDRVIVQAMPARENEVINRTLQLARA